MVYYLFLPFLSILLIVLQNMVADIIFSGSVIVELSVIVLVYAGFRFDLIKGSISAFILGFVFDCICGSALGLFTLIYVLIFLFSFFVSATLITEKMFLIALFTFFCALMEEFIVVLFYNLFYGFDMFHNTPAAFLLQALIVGLLAPVFFYLMRKVEVFFYDKPAQSAQWAGTGRIPTET
jgi:rod shape-determining protein MreD